MTAELFIDIETYSPRDIRRHSVYSYSEDPEFQILMAAWALDDGPVQVAIGAGEIADIPGLDDPDVLKVAHNAPFERVCFSEFLAGYLVRERGVYLPPEEWDDTMMLAAEWGYPKKLEHLAKALGGALKDSAGTRLINLFCKPNRQGRRVMPGERPEEWAAFVEYCRQDVVAHRDIWRTLQAKHGGWPNAAERQAWLTDQRINDRGIKVDVEMARIAVEEAEANQMLQEIEVAQLTGVANPGSNPQMLAWLKGQGVEVDNLQKATVEKLLEGPVQKVGLENSGFTPEQQAHGWPHAEDAPAPGLPGNVRRVLELRQELALVASKKYTAALERTSERDHRLRGAFRFFGAHTGRWAGSGVQLQNMPSDTLAQKGDSQEQQELLISGAVVDLKMGNGADAHTLKALVRSMFEGPFTVVDYSAIEARVVAWLAGEQWALDAFADGRDIYVETAERMGGMSRKEGKVAVLALGYNGGTNSLRAMGAEGTDDKLKFLVNQWRDANPSIVQLWYQMQDAFKRGGPVGDHLEVIKDGADRYIQLPSGRALAYHDCKQRWVEKWGKNVQQISFADPKGPGIRTDTYGGRLVENVTQAVARDILAEALVRLDELAVPVVGHVHDEILTTGGVSVQEVADIMVQQPAWADGLPLAAEGFTCSRYRKDVS